MEKEIISLNNLPPQPTRYRGMGDVVKQITKVTGIEWLVNKFSQAIGKDCGCQNRQELLNQILPFHRGQK